MFFHSAHKFSFLSLFLVGLVAAGQVVLNSRPDQEPVRAFAVEFDRVYRRPIAGHAAYTMRWYSSSITDAARNRLAEIVRSMGPAQANAAYTLPADSVEGSTAGVADAYFDRTRFLLVSEMFAQGNSHLEGQFYGPEGFWDWRTEGTGTSATVQPPVSELEDYVSGAASSFISDRQRVSFWLHSLVSECEWSFDEDGTIRGGLDMSRPGAPRIFPQSIRPLLSAHRLGGMGSIVCEPDTMTVVETWQDQAGNRIYEAKFELGVSDSRKLTNRRFVPGTDEVYQVSETSVHYHVPTGTVLKERLDWTPIVGWQVSDLRFGSLVQYVYGQKSEIELKEEVRRRELIQAALFPTPLVDFLSATGAGRESGAGQRRSLLVDGDVRVQASSEGVVGVIGSRIGYSMHIVNSGVVDLPVSVLESDCACLRAQLDGAIIPAGGEVVLRLEMLLPQKPGKNRSLVSVTVGGGGGQRTLNIAYDVHAIAPPLWVSPGLVELAVEREDEVRGKLKLYRGNGQESGGFEGEPKFGDVDLCRVSFEPVDANEGDIFVHLEGVEGLPFGVTVRRIEVSLDQDGVTHLAAFSVVLYKGNSELKFDALEAVIVASSGNGAFSLDSLADSAGTRFELLGVEAVVPGGADLQAEVIGSELRWSWRKRPSGGAVYQISLKDMDTGRLWSVAVVVAEDLSKSTF